PFSISRSHTHPPLHSFPTRRSSDLPAAFKLARELDYPAKISQTLTLSTFHGCPANEIERICEFLLAERDLDVIVKMNPPMLGKRSEEHTSELQSRSDLVCRLLLEKK